MIKFTQPDCQALLRDIIENLPVQVYWKDRNSRYLGCNLLFATYAGVEAPADLIGKTDFELRWKDVADVCRSEDNFVMKYGVPKLSNEEPELALDGSMVWMRTTKVPLRDNEGKVIGVLGLSHDMTDLMRAREAEDRLARAVTLLWNSTTLSGTSVTVADYLTRTCKMLVQDGSYQIAWAAMRGGEPGEHFRPVAWAGFGEREPDPWALGRLYAAQFDITPRVEQSASLQDYGYLSGIAVPLRQGGEIVGAISVYRGRPYAFQEQELMLLEAIARNVEFGLEILCSRNG